MNQLQKVLQLTLRTLLLQKARIETRRTEVGGYDFKLPTSTLTVSNISIAKVLKAIRAVYGKDEFIDIGSIKGREYGKIVQTSYSETVASGGLLTVLIPDEIKKGVQVFDEVSVQTSKSIVTPVDECKVIVVLSWSGYCGSDLYVDKDNEEVVCS